MAATCTRLSDTCACITKMLKLLLPPCDSVGLPATARWGFLVFRMIDATARTTSASRSSVRRKGSVERGRILISDRVTKTTRQECEGL